MRADIRRCSFVWDARRGEGGSVKDPSEVEAKLLACHQQLVRFSAVRVVLSLLEHATASLAPVLECDGNTITRLLRVAQLTDFAPKVKPLTTRPHRQRPRLSAVACLPCRAHAGNTESR